MRATTRAMVVAAALLGTVGLPLFAQAVISAQSGLVNYTEGPVSLNGKEAQPRRGVFPQMKEQETLQTTRGRAELLLNPGVFLRVGRDSSIRLLSDKLTDSRVELVTGTMVLEAAEIQKDTSVTLHYGNAAISIQKRGVYRVDSDPAGLRVFGGKAVVESGGQRIEVGKGKMLAFDGSLALAKFNRKKPDTLDQWSQRRAQYLAGVNLSTARSLLGRSDAWLCSGWCWNSMFGIVTFVPLSGMYMSPYGYYFVSPREVWRTSAPAASGGAGGRGNGSTATGGGSTYGSAAAGSTTRVEAPARVAAPAPSTPSSRPAPPAMQRLGK